MMSHKCAEVPTGTIDLVYLRGFLERHIVHEGQFGEEDGEHESYHQSHICLPLCKSLLLDLPCCSCL